MLTRGPDKKWMVDKTGEGSLKEAAFTQFVSALSDLRGFEIAADSTSDLGLYGLATPTITITVYNEKNEQLAAIQGGQKAEGDTKKSFVKSAGSSTVFALRDYIFD